MASDFLGWILSPLLFCLSLLYGWLLGIRRVLWKFGFFSRHKLQGTVLSIGNVEVGGTGKSPVVMSLCAFLRKKDFFPAILTRGYGVPLGRSDHMILLGGICISSSRPELPMPDEARMQSLRLPEVPVVVGPHRYHAYGKFKELQKRGAFGIDFPEVTHWVLDDGFQHWALARQWDIVLLGALSASGRRLVPWGRLREPLKALNRAQVILRTRGDPLNSRREWESLCKKIPLRQEIPTFDVRLKALPIGRSVDWTRYGLGLLKGHETPVSFSSPMHLPAFLVCGIAKPQGFLSDFCEIYEPTKKDTRSAVAGSFAVADHQEFSIDLILREMGKKEFSSIVTTEKDMARNPSLFQKLEEKTNKKIFVLELALMDEDNLWTKINLI